MRVTLPNPLNFVSSYDVQLTSGCMRVKLPSDAEMVICKDAGDQALRVESNLHDIYGGGDPRDEASFK